MDEAVLQILEDLVVVHQRRYDRVVECKEASSNDEKDVALIALLNAKLELARYKGDK